MTTITTLFYAAMALLWTAAAPAASLSPVESLGKNLLFDSNLSTPKGQACADCHGTSVGFTGPDQIINAHGAVHPGAVTTRFGNRKPSSYGYAGYAPHLSYAGGGWVGGLFWDGRATGNLLGDPLAEQAQGPFLNPLEQNNPNAAAVCNKVKASNYAGLFARVWGIRALDCSSVGIAAAYEKIARSIAAYERSFEVNAFSSKFDAFWNAATAAGWDVTQINPGNQANYENLGLNSHELNGLALFNSQAHCSNCHVLSSVNGKPPVFTDFSFDNLGVPKNPENPFYGETDFNPAGADWVDPGLGGFLKNSGQLPAVYDSAMGQMQVQTLRNVDKRPYPAFVKAYMHNGYFKSLESVVHFYNTRDILPSCETLGAPLPGVSCWPSPETPQNINTVELGNLGLSTQQEADLVSFLKTLTDTP
jgi:cytochrome c peroxidase